MRDFGKHFFILDSVFSRCHYTLRKLNVTLLRLLNFVLPQPRPDFFNPGVGFNFL